MTIKISMQLQYVLFSHARCIDISIFERQVVLKRGARGRKRDINLIIFDENHGVLSSYSSVYARMHVIVIRRYVSGLVLREQKRRE